MATVKIDKFMGIMPRLHPSLLPDGMATEAYNCRLKSGKLVPIKNPSFVDASTHEVFLENGLNSIADANSLYCWKHTLSDGTVRTDFLAFPGDVYFARGNIADDQYDRVFVSGDTGVSYTTSLGVKYDNVPAAYMFDRKNSNTDYHSNVIRHPLFKEEMDAPMCSFEGDLEDANQIYAYFFLTWVDEYGYESPASSPSKNKNGTSAYSDDALVLNSNKSVTFQPIVIPASAVAVRVYMTNTGDETDNIQFLKEFSQAELPSLLNVFSVMVDTTQVGEAMPEIEAIPSDLRDMTFVPGNFYAGRSPSMPHTVAFSDVDNPTNWAMAYRYDIKDNVVKLAATSNTVFALTDGYPYVFSGTAPESMTVSSLAGPAACVSEKGVCVFKNALFFVSNYGIFTIYNDADEGTLCKCITDKYFTKDQWLALNPSSAIMGQFDGALHLFFTAPSGSTYSDLTTHKAMIIDLAEKECAITTHNEAATCLCTDDRTDEMYFVRVV